jgi:hypothetical protein
VIPEQVGHGTPPVTSSGLYSITYEFTYERRPTPGPV